MTQDTQDTSARLTEAINSLIDQLNNEHTEAAASEENISEENTSEEIEEQAAYPEYPSISSETTVPEQSYDRISANSETITIDASTSRFSGAVWYNKVQEKTITLAGLGGIGSYVAFLLSRMKPSHIRIYDDDTVEWANMSGQFYSVLDLNKTKAQAMTDMMHNYSSYYSITSVNERFTINSPSTDIMICGFDNMAARRIFYHVWKHYVMSRPEELRKHCLFIDGRLAAEEFQVLCIQGDDSYNMERYERDWLFSDNEADATLCSYKQTTFMANMIGSIMTNLFVNFCANDLEGDEKPVIDRSLPFLTSYDASLMMFTTEA